MKNIHMSPTDKPSRLFDDGIELYLGELKDRKEHPVTNYNIYITFDEEIKRGDCILLPNNEIIVLPTGLSQVPLNNFIRGYSLSDCKKIILTTDQDLIKDGVQAIDDEFLEWFVKNPSCDFAHLGFKSIIGDSETKTTYKIIIPKEEPKQETLEEFIQRQLSLGKYQDQESAIKNSIELTAKWQQERSYNEEEVLDLLFDFQIHRNDLEKCVEAREWFEQFKKK